jgi:two-component system, NarL family, response regulator
MALALLKCFAQVGQRLPPSVFRGVGPNYCIVRRQYVHTLMVSRAPAMEQAGTKLRVLVADDHPLFRAGVVAVISREADMVVVAEAGDGRDAARLYREHTPDVAVMDLRMPGLGGVEAISIIVSEYPNARVLVITTYQGDVEALRAIKAGATGYLLKSSMLEELSIAIRQVAKGKKFVPAEIAAGLASHALDDELTLREIAVMESVASGNSNFLVARELAISEETVKSHMRSIMAKLGARDRTHAVSIGIKRGIIKS